MIPQKRKLTSKQISSYENSTQKQESTKSNKKSDNKSNPSFDSTKSKKKATSSSTQNTDDNRTTIYSSDECHNCTCTSNLSRAALLEFVENIHQQPAYIGYIASRGPLNMERIQVALVEDYIVHDRTSNELNAKQVRLRQALRRIAIKLNMPFLAQFNTKTTSLRTFGRALWDGCSLAEPKKKTTELQTIQKDNLNKVEKVLEHVITNYENCSIGSEKIIHDAMNMISLKDDTRAIYQSQLMDDGLCLCPSLIPEILCHHILSNIGNYTNNKDSTKLTETSATGSNGIYYDKNFTCSGDLVTKIQQRLFDQLGLDGMFPESSKDKKCERMESLPSCNTKAILLCYTLNAENWTHQDDNSEFPYQALIMLSEPTVDFNRGELHVLNGTNDEWSTTAIPFQGRGDVVVFRSNGMYFHGMNQVIQGRKEMTSRIALGLFHQLR
jgi:hypothetical protein